MKWWFSMFFVVAAATAAGPYTEIASIADALRRGVSDQKLAQDLRSLPRQIPASQAEASRALDRRIQVFRAAQQYYEERVTAWATLDRLLQGVTLEPPLPDAAGLMTNMTNQLRSDVLRIHGETRGLTLGALRDAQVEELHRAATSMKWADLETAEIENLHRTELTKERPRLIALLMRVRIESMRDAELARRFAIGAEVAQRARARLQLSLTSKYRR